jgi:uncharacterized protein YhaN
VLRDREIELPAGAALVFGANESGKTTFRSALETVLYGFEPAERDAHPAAVWGDAAELCLEAELARDQGPPLRIERTLLSRGHLRFAEGGAELGGRRQGNVALDCVSSLPRALFRQVYSLELAQLTAFDAAAQARIDELLLPQASVLGLRPVSELRAELREAHQSLWRPNRLGKPEAQQRRSELEKLREQAGEAAREERGLRDALLEQAELRARRAAADERRRELERIDREAPFLRDLFELARRRRTLGAALDLSPLGDLQLSDPAALAREIDELANAAREPEARLARAGESLAANEAALLAAAAEVARARSAAAELRAESKQCTDRRAAAAELRERARSELAAVLAQAPTDAELAAARRVPLEALRAAHAQWTDAIDQHVASAPPHLSAWGWSAVVLAGTLGGLALLLEPWLGPLARLLAFVAAGAGALAVLAGWLRHWRRGPPQPPSTLAELLAELPPSPALREQPSALQHFIDRLSDAQRTLAQARGEVVGAETGETAMFERDRRLGELCSRLGFDAGGDPEQRSSRLDAALERARERERQVERDRSERASAQQRLEGARPRLARAREHHERVAALLRAAEPGAATLEQAYTRVKERLAEAEFLRRREAQLRSDARFASFEHDPRASAERDPAAAEWSAEACAAREAEIARLGQELARIDTRLGEIASLLRSDPGGRQAKVADRIAEVSARLAALCRERDRLALLESILMRAERRFREQHQPPVLQRASEYLARVTRGRWRRVDFEEGPGGGLFVSGDPRSEPLRAAPPLSQGTLDQIFLCLRFGLLDHLDEGRERLPLVLDDALLRMDDARRPEVYGLLAEISRRRQVFLLTCHESIAAEAEQALAIPRITLRP